MHVPAHRAQRRGLRLAAALGHGLGEVREQHREPEPRRDREHERRAGRPSGARRTRPRTPITVVKMLPTIDDEHHRVAELHARVQLRERVADRGRSRSAA